MVFDLPAHGGAFNERMVAPQALARSLAIAWVQPVAQFKVDDATALQARVRATTATGVPRFARFLRVREQRVTARFGSSAALTEIVGSMHAIALQSVRGLVCAVA
jgi:hypothetical protein